MRLNLLYFGVLKESMGVAGQEMEAPEGTTVRALLRILQERTSNNRAADEVRERIWQSLAVAVNRHYATVDVELREGDEVALLPPVSGGVGERWVL